MRALSLHQITALEAGPVELVRIAAECGASDVCIFVHVPREALPGRRGPDARFPLVDAGLKSEMLEQLAEYGVGVANLEFFPLGPDVQIEAFESALALGKELGGRRIVTHVHDPDAARVLDRLGRLCEMAARHELDVGLEFMGLSAACASLSQARALVERARQPNLGIAVDALHLVRTGSSIAELRAVEASQFSYAQLCDGTHLGVSSDYLDEALNRTVPGEGCFPLTEMLSALPADLPLDVEVPASRLAAAGKPALERTRAAMQGSRRILAAAQPNR